MDPRSEGMPWLTPYLTVSDPNRALDFYSTAFGFERAEVMEEDGQITHAGMKYRDKTIVMFAPETACDSIAQTPAHGGFECPIGLYVYVDDVDAAYRRAIEAGAKGVMEPHDMFWGDRMTSVRDPDGYVWSLAHRLPTS